MFQHISKYGSVAEDLFSNVSMLVVDVNCSVGKEPGDGEEKGGGAVHPGGGHVLFDLRHCHLNHLDKFALHMEYHEAWTKYI